MKLLSYGKSVTSQKPLARPGVLEKLFFEDAFLAIRSAKSGIA
jgi:hypothetical protein